MPKNIKKAESKTKQEEKKNFVNPQRIAESSTIDTINTNELKDHKRKLSLQTWISIGNLVLTAIVGIAVAVYLQQSEQTFQRELQNREEELQKQIITLQSQSEIAKVRITTASVYPLDGIEIENTGLTSAKNLRIVLCATSINNLWADFVSDMLMFDIATDNIALKFNKETTKTGCINVSGAQHDSIVITLESLPPNQPVIFKIYPPQSIPTEYVLTSQEAHIAVQKDLIPEDYSMPFETNFYDPLFEYLNHKFYTAYFLVDASCENCQVEKDVEFLRLRLHYLWDWRNTVITSEDGSYIRANFVFDTKYQVPLGKSFPDTPLYLLLSNSDPSTLLEISQEEYNSLR